MFRRIISVAAALAFAFVAVAEVRSGFYLARTYSLLGVYPLEALRKNWRAIEVNPMDAAPRRQIQLTLLRVVHVYWPKVKIDAAAQDLIYRTASSAGPDHPATLIARAEILVNFGRANEAGPVIDRLNALHPRQAANLRIGVLK